MDTNILHGLAPVKLVVCNIITNKASFFNSTACTDDFPIAENSFLLFQLNSFGFPIAKLIIFRFKLDLPHFHRSL